MSAELSATTNMKSGSSSGFQSHLPDYLGYSPGWQFYAAYTLPKRCNDRRRQIRKQLLLKTGQIETLAVPYIASDDLLFPGLLHQENTGLVY